MGATLKGFYRLGGPSAARDTSGGQDTSGVQARTTAQVQTETDAPGFGLQLLEGAQKLVPGEALAGYVSLCSSAELVQNLGTGQAGAPAVPLAPGSSMQVLLALAFLAVTIFLRVLGTMDPRAARPVTTIQWWVVIFSALAFIALVYATRGQIWWHAAFGSAEEQRFLGQAAAAVLGIVVPVAYAFRAARK